MTKHQTIIHPLRPLFELTQGFDGLFPSIKTRNTASSMGTPESFLALAGADFDVELSTDIAERRDFLLRHCLAVYDVIYQCDIVGSSDASIQNVIPSDLSPIFKEANIQRVFCNGGTAYRYYRKYQERKTGLQAVQLPSTSPANARASMDDLYNQWKIIRENL